MKKLVYLFLALILLPLLAKSQEVQIIPFASYQWGGKIYFYGGDIKIDDSKNYGIAMNVLIPGGKALHLEYMQQPTTFQLRSIDYTNDGYEEYPVNLNWFQIGAMQHVVAGAGNVMPFAGLTLGALYANPRTSTIEDVWKFSFTMQVGLKYYFNEKIGIRIHGGMLVPVQYGGFGLYFGSGGASAGVTTSSTILQGEIGAGLVFRLNTTTGAASTTPPAF